MSIYERGGSKVHRSWKDNVLEEFRREWCHMALHSDQYSLQSVDDCARHQPPLQAHCNCLIDTSAIVESYFELCELALDCEQSKA